MNQATKILAGAVTGMTLIGGGVGLADQTVNPYQDKGNYYNLPIHTEVAQDDHVEISKSAPAVTLSRWNDEERITISPNIPGLGHTSAAERPLLSKRMEYTDGSISTYVEPSETPSDFNIDFTLASEPSSNIFTYTVTGADDVDFFYQPPLNELYPNVKDCTPTDCTDPVVGGRIHRPNNIVGSYAVYSKDKHNHVIGEPDYGTGKLFNIYRPQAVDAKGNSVWAALSYKEGLLTVEVPQSFLDTATYPITIDPTFGYTTIGGTQLTGISGFCLSTIFGAYTATTNDTITSFSFAASVASGSGTLDMAAYTFSGGHPVTRLASAITTTVNSAVAQIWTTTPVSQIMTAGTTYVPAFGGFGTSMIVYRDTTTGTNVDGAASATLPATWSSITNNADKYTMYATYSNIPPVVGGPHSQVILNQSKAIQSQGLTVIN